jgi:hypothetical protein
VSSEDLERVREALVKRLDIKKYKKYPDEPWRELRKAYGDDDLVKALRSEEEWEALVPIARLAYNSWVAGGSRESSRGKETGERVPSRIADHERERSRVYSECLARHASADPIVQGFRFNYLDDQLLSPQQARALLTSPIAAHWPRTAFDTLGVPLVGHVYRVQEDMRDEEGPYSLAEVSTPDSSRNRSIRPLKDRRRLQPGPWEILDRPADARSNGRPRRELDKTWKVVPFPGEDGHTHRVLVRSGSVLGALHKEVGELIQRYPWEESDAVWFLLTGEPPEVSPVTWQARWFGGDETISSFRQGEDSFSYGFITLKIEPWVSPESVQQIYSDAERTLRGEHRVRRLEDKSLKLLQFVTERVDPLGLTPEERELTPRQLRRRMGQKLVDAWDKENPGDTYGSNTRKFWRDFNRARRAVLSPEYARIDNVE